MSANEPIDLATIRAERILDALDVASYIWAGEANIEGMVANVTSPMRLNRSVPNDVRDRFAARMREQMLSIILMAFVEGSYRSFEMVKQLRLERDTLLSAKEGPPTKGTQHDG